MCESGFTSKLLLVRSFISYSSSLMRTSACFSVELSFSLTPESFVFCFGSSAELQPLSPPAGPSSLHIPPVVQQDVTCGLSLCRTDTHTPVQPGRKVPEVSRVSYTSCLPDGP